LIPAVERTIFLGSRYHQTDINVGRQMIATKLCGSRAARGQQLL